jgi:hypothetical protein
MMFAGRRDQQACRKFAGSKAQRKQVYRLPTGESRIRAVPTFQS